MLLLLAFLGQSLAVVGAPCAQPQTDSGSHMAGMDHSGHQMAADSDATGCCEGGGFCSMSHCLAVAAIPVAAVDTALEPGGNLPQTCSHSAPRSPRAPLFRPPIQR